MKYLRIRTTVSVIQTDPTENVEIPMKLFDRSYFNVVVDGEPITINTQHIVEIRVVET